MECNIVCSIFNTKCIVKGGVCLCVLIIVWLLIDCLRILCPTDPGVTDGPCVSTGDTEALAASPRLMELLQMEGQDSIKLPPGK